MSSIKLSKKGDELIKLYEEMALNGIDRTDCTRKEIKQSFFEGTMNGYFLVADILGFGEIIKNTPDSELPYRIGERVELVECLCENHEISNYQVISDTLFIGL